MIGSMKMNKKNICAYLDEIIPNPICELKYNKDYELLLATMLSAQTTDKKVNEITKKLFHKYNSIDKLNKLSIEEIENNIKSIGLYKTKAKNFRNIIQNIKENGNIVPKEREVLEKMQGVGRKTASVVLAELYDIPSMPVDTHVERVSKRLYLADEKDNVLEIEKKLCNFFEKEKWNRIHKQFVLFGRYYCTSKNPKCVNCKFKNNCKYYKSL